MNNFIYISSRKNTDYSIVIAFIYPIIIGTLVLLAGCSIQHKGLQNESTNSFTQKERTARLEDKLESVIRNSSNKQRFSKLSEKSQVNVEIKNQYTSATGEECYVCAIKGYQDIFLFCKSSTGEILSVRDFE